jgi:hypothetical protein
MRETALALLQQRLEHEKRALFATEIVRTAILVPDTRLAYLARIAFGLVGEERYRVFYNDFAGALKWLQSCSANRGPA